MKIKILSIFPQIFDGFISTSLIEKASKKGLIEISTLNIREFSDPPHNQTDDIPYGGGAGMVMKAPPLVRAIRKAREQLPKAQVVLLSPSGRSFSQEMAQELSGQDLILVAGRYEGVDQRVIELEIDHQVSIGDYILMGGEVAAMVVIEATTRLVPGVLGNHGSTSSESFSKSTNSMLEAPQYTRPQIFEGLSVPDVLLSGDHAAIDSWRRSEGLKLTEKNRPDLIKRDK